MSAPDLAAAVGDRPDGEATAVLVRVTGPDGTTERGSGAADPATGRPVGPHLAFRIGGVTKTFVAATVLSLAAEGLIDLDEPVAVHLPGVLRAPATVRQLLDHTAGLADESDVRYNDTGWFLRHRFDTFTPEQLAARAVRLPPAFEPGTAQQITRAGYVLAGMLIEQVTGNPYAAEIRSRILRPLGLRRTFLPGADPALPEPCLRGFDEGIDVTEHSPSIHGAAGEMLSTVDDLDRFLAALLAEEVIPGKELRQMFRVPRVRYLGGGEAFCGAGLDSVVVPGGGTVWGMAGIVHGHLGGIAATVDPGTLRPKRRLVYMVAPTARGRLRVPPVAQRIILAAFGG